jgi:hypothetical protein
MSQHRFRHNAQGQRGRSSGRQAEKRTAGCGRKSEVVVGVTIAGGHHSPHSRNLTANQLTCRSQHSAQPLIQVWTSVIPHFCANLARPVDYSRRPFVKRSIAAAIMLFCVALAIAALVPAAQPVQAGNAPNTADSKAIALGKAGDYCVKKGGEVDVREPYFNTNASEQDWLRLSGDRQFCKFTSKKDGSRIYVELSTLYTEQPTLAALAYYAEVQMGKLQRKSGIVLLLAAWRQRFVWRNQVPAAAGGSRSRIRSIPCSRPAFSPICRPSIPGDWPITRRESFAAKPVEGPAL